MEADPEALRKSLREAGLSDPMIDAAWPAWWSDEANSSQSANAELRFSIARKIGLSPQSLFNDQVEFVWKDDARFKHLSSETDSHKAAITSFGISISRLLLRSLPPFNFPYEISALTLRRMILQNRPFVDLPSLLATCWSIGIPVIHLRIFPLKAKRMHAMAVKVGGRYAILLGRDAKVPAPVIFTLAHEIGHVLLGHIGSSSAIVDVGDPLEPDQADGEEYEADRFALELLLGTSQPDLRTNRMKYNSRELAATMLAQGPAWRIEPGTLALCLGYAQGQWQLAIDAMRYIYIEEKPVWQEVNQIAARQMDMDGLNDESADYLRKIMGVDNV